MTTVLPIKNGANDSVINNWLILVALIIANLKCCAGGK